MEKKDFEAMVKKLIKVSDKKQLRYAVTDTRLPGWDMVYLCNDYVGAKAYVDCCDVESIIRSFGGKPLKTENLPEIMEEAMTYDNDNARLLENTGIFRKTTSVDGKKKYNLAFLAATSACDVVDVKQVNADYLSIISNGGKCTMCALPGKSMPVTVIGNCYGLIMPVYYDTATAGFIRDIGSAMVEQPKMVTYTVHAKK